MGPNSLFSIEVPKGVKDKCNLQGMVACFLITSAFQLPPPVNPNQLLVAQGIHQVAVVTEKGGAAAVEGDLVGGCK